ncbi:FAD-binding oxidoreductase [Streptomyces camelliae]|uniref:FAD-binding oxidoreductase n=1 Tax=Streptomyces camelliae TaxID=3004093 RepID=A0ABY7PCP1_9ACTN|nr:FAD-binding oxidoreductase [Streptomyces sp. HUAS 2-6]WBO68356.1 FAD-binding oxidoreductase [Streptomyces sp. HUAS 2-6]
MSTPSTGSRSRAPIEVGPGDDRYEALRRGFNQRWIASPEHVVVATSTADVEAAVNAWLDRHPGTGTPPRRITVRSGGHCYEDFVCGDDVAVIIDVSAMNRVSYDPEMDAYCVEAGASNWHIATQLYRTYGLAVPGGSCYSVGAGGHISAGGFGLLSRLHGLTVDHLYAVEVVTVRDRTRAAVTVARKDSADPAVRDLWWAHTGGGGGNFGVITRYWFRDLPRPPAQVLLRTVAWEWKLFEENPELFLGLVRRYGSFFEGEQSGGDSDFPGRYDHWDMFTLLKLNHRKAGKVGLIVQLDATRADSVHRLETFLDYLAPEPDYPRHPLDLRMGEHPALGELYIPTRLPWLTATQNLNESGPSRCGKYKSAYHTAGFTEDQLATIYDYLTDPEYSNDQALLQVDSYGGRINDLPADATAVPQRSSVLKLQFQTYWTWNRDANFDGVYDFQDARDDPGIAAPHLDWIRRFYREMYAATDGVPAVLPPGGAEAPEQNTDGCYIGYCDADLSDPEFNPPEAEQPWYRLYYKDNYDRLQRTKAHWDPRDVFRHRQSVRLPGTGAHP